MTPRAIGLAMIALGALLTLGGVAGLLLAPGQPSASPAATTSTSSTTLVPPTTTTSTATTAPAQEVTTTTVAATTTAPPPAPADPAELIGEFIPEFSAATEAGDVDFLFASLHPAVIEIYDEQTCRRFIANEIALLDGYRLVGEITGPTRETVGGLEVETYRAPVAFGFQGEEFEIGATFGLVDGEVRWFTQCA